MRVVLVIGLCAGCGDNLVPSDATAAFTCAVPSTGTHTLVLAFDGLQLTDAGMANAVYNQAGFVENDVATIPVWRASDPNRALAMQQVTCRIREALFPFDLRVTRQRPPGTDDYELIVFGGSAADLGQPVAVPALVDSDCANTNPRDVVWIAEYVADPQRPLSIGETAALATAYFGAGNGLVPSSDPANCMCAAGANTGCTTVAACAFAAAAPVRGSDDYCQTELAEQDQVGVLTARYGAR